MSSVDDRIVAMKFDNSRFLSGVRTTMSALDSLKKSLNFTGVTNGFNNLRNLVGRFDLNPLSNGVRSVTAHFSNMAFVAGAAISNITNRAVDAGVQLTKSLTVDPLSSGLGEYETNLNSIQTILANTQASGAGLKEVNAALEELNHYADKTIYNFSEMARNIGTFTAAGVDLDRATASIKGIANLAALSGSNSQQASTAMYQLSQAIAAGKVSLMDWNSVVNAGMGGTVFQRALAETAVAMGKLPKDAVKLEGAMKNVKINGQAFRESISAENGESWLTSEVLTSTLQQFTGDMTDAELAARGFSESQIREIQAMAQTAVQAATQVKTLSAVFDTAKEVAGSGWAKTWQLIFGDFEVAKTTFTAMSNFVNGFIERAAEARNELAKGWVEAGGRTKAIEGLTNLTNALLRALRAVGDGWRDVFPAFTVTSLVDLTERFANFTATLNDNANTFDYIRRTARGAGAALSIIGTIASTAIKTLVEGLDNTNFTFLAWTASIGDSIFEMQKFLKESDGIQKFFESFAAFLPRPIDLLETVWNSFNFLVDVLTPVKEAFQDLFPPKQVSTLREMVQNLRAFSEALFIGEHTADKIRETFHGVFAIFSIVGLVLSEIVGMFTDLIGPAQSSGDSILDFTANVGALLLHFENFLRTSEGFKDFFDSLGSILAVPFAIIKALPILLNNLLHALTPIGQAFLEVFGGGKLPLLKDFSATVESMAEKFRLSDKSAELLKNTFIGVFTVAQWGWDILKGLVSIVADVALGLGKLLGVVNDGGGEGNPFLRLTSWISDLIQEIDALIQRGGLIENFFGIIGTGVEKISTKASEGLLKLLGHDISSEGGGGGLVGSLDKLATGMENATEATGPLARAWDVLATSAQGLYDYVKPGIDAVVQGVKDFVGVIVREIEEGNYDEIFSVINTALLGGILLVVKNFFGDLSIEFGDGLLSGIKDTFEQLTGTLQTMQQKVQADILMQIAKALALLTVSMVALSMIDAKKLGKALTAMGVGLGQLLASMGVMAKIAGLGGIAVIPVIASSMVILSTAIVALTAAIIPLAMLNPTQLATGIAGIMGAITLLTSTAAILAKIGPGIVFAANAMIPLSIAIRILASAISKMAQLSWKQIGVGLTGLAGGLAIIAGAMWLMPPHMFVQALSLIAVANALVVLAVSMKIFGSMKWGEIGRGLTALAGGLLIIAGAMWIMPPHMAVQALGLIAVAGAVTVLGAALAVLGSMSWSQIGKGLFALGGALVALAAAMLIMNGALVGAGAMLIVSFALTQLAAALVLLGAMSWGSILKSLVALAGAFVVIGLAGAVLTPLIPSLLGLGAALLLLGAGLALTGAGAYLMASAFKMFAEAGQEGVQTIKDMIMLLPEMMIALAQGILDFATTIANGTATFVEAFTKLLLGLLDAIIIMSPKIAETFYVLIHELGRILVDNVPYIVEEGINLMRLLFIAMNDEIPQIIPVIVLFIETVLEELGKAAQPLGDAGYSFIIAVIDGIAASIEKNNGRLVDASSRLGNAIVDGLIDGVETGMTDVVYWAGKLAYSVLDTAARILGIASPSKEFEKIGMYSAEGMANGLTAGVGKVKSASQDMAEAALDGARSLTDQINDFFNGSINFDVNPAVTPVKNSSSGRYSERVMRRYVDQLNKKYRRDNGLGPDPRTIRDAIDRTRRATPVEKRDTINSYVRNPDTKSSSAPTTNYTQIINSPVPVDTVAVYRNTKNQLTAPRLKEDGTWAYY